MSIQSVEEAAAAYAAAYARLRAEVQAAQVSGVPDAKIARAAGVSRTTIQNWTGKGRKPAP